MLTKQRVNQLVDLAKSLKAEEMQLMLGAFVLDCAQEITIDYLNDDLEDYQDQEMFQGADLWVQGSFMLEDLTDQQEVAAVINKYDIASNFNIVIEKKWTARKA